MGAQQELTCNLQVHSLLSACSHTWSLIMAVRGEETRPDTSHDPFLPCSLIVAILKLPAYLLTSTHLLPWRHLISWHVDQFVPPYTLTLGILLLLPRPTLCLLLFIPLASQQSVVHQRFLSQRFPIKGARGSVPTWSRGQLQARDLL